VITKEKLQHRISHLQESHDALDVRIKADLDPEYITRVLKKEKLELKDEINKLNKRIENMNE
jgi:hypothetical protein